MQLFDRWFLSHAPKTFREERERATQAVRDTFMWTADFTELTPEVLEAHPSVVEALRMATTPPLARDRLIGLAQVSKNLVGCLEEGRLPKKAIGTQLLADSLKRICRVVEPLLDPELFPSRAKNLRPSEKERELASFVIADRLCTSIANPIVRNAHQTRQKEILRALLVKAGYAENAHPAELPINFMKPGTFAFAMNVPTKVAIVAVDLVIQPKQPTGTRTPIITELKAAGDFTNVNKRRKEESEKFRNLKGQYGSDLKLILFLCGYFDRNYLQYGADNGIDWVWEHRPEDLLPVLT
ncbi:MAG TPA: XamI family restriction endonuclease [Thermoanaerobaculia bacterium]|nr:XamI family restriction endonuclease [Thermoanaerobaculia bacterium]